MNLETALNIIKKRWPTVVSSAQEEPVFVLAAGWRSGSTLLQRMLLSKCMVWGEPYGSSGIISHLVEPLTRFSSSWPEEEALISNPRWDQPLNTMWTANLYPPVQSLLDAHVAFFRTLLAEPGRFRGFARWGLKEVRYGMDYALYLRWLFPRAKFLFLVRNPYECWASVSRCQASWVRFYPEPELSTPELFGAHWSRIVESCHDRFEEVGGFPIRYELLIRSDFDPRPLASYLEFEPDSSVRALQIGAAPPGWVMAEEMERLRTAVEPWADRLGYRNPFSRGG